MRHYDLVVSVRPNGSKILEPIIFAMMDIGII